jgi:hypothetical protein
LNTNEPPSGSEITFVHSVISKADARVAHIDEEVTELQEMLKHLRAERASLYRYRKRNRAILSPLRRMPPEMLGEIFALTVPSFNAALSGNGINMVRSPWLLTQVGSLWRAVSVSTPSLWSRVVIDFKNGYHNPVPLIELQLQRAQSLKIHFYGSETADSRLQNQLFQLLSEQSLRWEELWLVLTSDMVPLLAALRGRLSSLKQVQMETCFVQTPADPLDCFQTAPSLVTFGLYNSHRSRTITLPAHQLTRAQLNGPWRWIKDILKSASMLVEANFGIQSDDPSPREFGELIGLPHLRRLYVSDPEFLKCLRTPALEALGFYVVKNPSLDILLLLQTLIDRSTCLLRRLCLRGCADANITAEILERFPSINEFGTITASDRNRVDDLMAKLAAPKPGGTVISPQLRSLFFAREKGSKPIDYDAFLAMLKSRWGADVSELQNAALLFTQGCGPDRPTLRKLHVLRREGLNLSILEGSEAMKEVAAWLYWSSPRG